MVGRGTENMAQNEITNYVKDQGPEGLERYIMGSHNNARILEPVCMRVYVIYFFSNHQLTEMTSKDNILPQYKHFCI